MGKEFFLTPEEVLYVYDNTAKSFDDESDDCDEWDFEDSHTKHEPVEAQISSSLKKKLRKHILKALGATDEKEEKEKKFVDWYDKQQQKLQSQNEEIMSARKEYILKRIEELDVSLRCQSCPDLVERYSVERDGLTKELNEILKLEKDSKQLLKG
jgi:hypothetical protein